MNFKYETQGTATFLVYAVEENDVIDSMSLGMLTNNKIPGLAVTAFTQMDAKRFIKYNVSAKVSARQFFSGAVNKKRLLGVFTGITDAMLSAEDYMIDPNTLLLDMDHIFADVTTCETVLICLPIIRPDSGESKVDLISFFKDIMFTTQFDQTENCDHVAKIMNYLNSVPVLSLTEFKKLLSSVSDAPKNISTQPAKQQPKIVSVSSAGPISKPETKVQANTMPSPKPPVSEVRPPVLPRPAVANPAVNPPSKMEIPPYQAHSENKTTTQDSPQNPEKKMSWFYLMQHYNSENAAAYKEQKAAKKAEKQQAQPAGGGFVVPGAPVAQPKMPENVNFAVPGQPSAPPAPPRQPAAQSSPNRQPAGVPVVPAVSGSAIPQPISPRPPQTPPEPGTRNVNFGETVVLSQSAAGETTVLNTSDISALKRLVPYLLRVKNNEKIPVNKPDYKIGKERSWADYFIADNTAVSRSHAIITSRNDEYFIIDINSTNHTYLNGTKIPSNKEMKLSNGDKIRLANEEFEFILTG